MTTLEMLVGLPACGKSTYAKKKGFKIFSSDEIREENKIEGYSKEENNKVFEILHSSIKAALQSGEDCVYDATNLNGKKRRAFLDSISRVPCKKVCVFFVVPIEECKRRNQTRTGRARVPDETYDRMLKSFDCPYYYEGFDEIRIINDTAAYKRDWNWRELCHFDQENDYHSMALGFHSLAVMNYLRKKFGEMYDNPKLREYFNTLMVAALFHDIGKIYTKSFLNSKGEKTDKAHYYSHEHYGSYVFLVDALYNGNSVANSLYIATLINWHMKPHTWSHAKNCRDRDRKLLGEDLYQDVMLLHEADRSSH